MNLLQEIILKYPTAPWNWKLLSSNPSITFDFVINHPELPWELKYVSKNKSITETDIRTNMNFAWDSEGLSMNPNLSLSFFEEYMIKPDVVHHVDWQYLSANSSITMIDVINNPQYNWDDLYLSMNTNLNSNFILNEGNERKWFIPSVCSNPGITSRDIFKCTLKPLLQDKGGWNYRNLSSNPNLPIQFVKANITKDWNYYAISTNVSINDLETYGQIKWDGYGLSLNPNITLDYIKRHSKIRWNIPVLLSNSSLSLKTIMDNKDWFEKQINNPIERYMSANSTITSAWIDRNYRHIDWNALSMNPLSKKIQSS